MLNIWSDPPPIDVRAPEPALLVEGHQLWLAYRTRRQDHFAVLLFSGLVRLSFGRPGDDTLSGHPLLAAGLEPCRFSELTRGNMAMGADRDEARSGVRRWMAPFHDDLLDVQATTAQVVVRAVEAPDAPGALAAIRA